MMDHAAETLIALDELISAAKLLRTRVEIGVAFPTSEPMGLVTKARTVQYHALRTHDAGAIFGEQPLPYKQTITLPASQSPADVPLGYEAASTLYGGFKEFIGDIERDAKEPR